ncbi:MAG: DUF2934 domain-containing protein [Pseudomonadota bacterium]
MARKPRSSSRPQPAQTSASADGAAAPTRPRRKESAEALDSEDSVIEPQGRYPGHTPLMPDGEIRQQMVAEAAYYRALNRGFNGGDPNEDWFAAEREIDARSDATC